MCLAMAALTPALPQSAKPTAIPAETPKVHLTGTHDVPLIADGLRLSDFTGMEPRAELKGKLLKVAGFIQNAPHDGEPETEKTDSLRQVPSGLMLNLPDFTVISAFSCEMAQGTDFPFTLTSA